MEKLDFNYFTLYLKKYLRDEGDPRADDVAFLNERGERAGIEAERCRREGMTVYQSIEVGIHVLMSGLDDQEEEDDIVQEMLDHDLAIEIIARLRSEAIRRKHAATSDEERKAADAEIQAYNADESILNGYGSDEERAAVITKLFRSKQLMATKLEDGTSAYDYVMSWPKEDQPWAMAGVLSCIGKGYSLNRLTINWEARDIRYNSVTPQDILNM